MGALFVQVKYVLCNNFYTENKIPVIKILNTKNQENSRNFVPLKVYYCLECVCDVIMIDVQYFLFTVNIQLLCNDSVVSHMTMLLKFHFSHLLP